MAGNQDAGLGDAGHAKRDTSLRALPRAVEKLDLGEDRLSRGFVKSLDADEERVAYDALHTVCHGRRAAGGAEL
ncbi:hypothetical protein DL765_001618 [Monosporascus sp. GIB2]|nr:hypothetical protein DL765_001618 [Monosporascus sp. GIB2]